MHLLFCGLLYFLPSFIGHRKQGFTGIFLVNLLLGWTVIGWFVALIWACTAEEQPRYYAVAGYGPSPARFCSRCGAAAVGVGAYCWRCGARV
jgi:uncharacterized membrane protein YqaE (UPF0057 family)